MTAYSYQYRHLSIYKYAGVKGRQPKEGVPICTAANTVHRHSKLAPFLRPRHPKQRLVSFKSISVLCYAMCTGQS